MGAFRGTRTDFNPYKHTMRQYLSTKSFWCSETIPFPIVSALKTSDAFEGFARSVRMSNFPKRFYPTILFRVGSYGSKGLQGKRKNHVKAKAKFFPAEKLTKPTQ
jgi:hypothetical protein